MGAIHATGFTDKMYRVLPKSVYLKDSAVEHSADKTERLHEVFSTKTHDSILSFRVRPLPGCCGVLTVYYLRPSGKNKVTTFKKWVLIILKAAGLARFGQVIFTQKAASEGADVLSRLPSGVRVPFTNWKTKNAVETFLFPTVEPKSKLRKTPTFSGE